MGTCACAAVGHEPPSHCQRDGHEYRHRGLRGSEVSKCRGGEGYRRLRLRKSNSCEEGHQWQLAISLLTELSTTRVHRTDTVNTAASACERGRKWQQALRVFDDAFRAGVAPSPVSLVVLLSACATGNFWEAALTWLSRASDKGDFATQTACLNAAITCCARAVQWEHSAAILFNQSSVSKDIISYSSAMDACRWGRAWPSAASLLATSAEARVDLGAVAHRSVVECLEHVQKWEGIVRMRLEASVLARAARAGHASDPDSWFWMSWWLLENLEPQLGGQGQLFRSFRASVEQFTSLTSPRLQAFESLEELASHPSSLSSLPCGIARHSAEELELGGALCGIRVGNPGEQPRQSVVRRSFETAPN
ncbi:unnamed protein product [Symbiodinium natans]|uniref:Pentatricopeptide repeat-containing protein, chloroplastic n=1 Tax=Symbiodinium natans TaxID=878477 RepID=A0A812U656_9DINO|nr:unnamed protein product [Symbiodinium natans]